MWPPHVPTFFLCLGSNFLVAHPCRLVKEMRSSIYTWLLKKGVLGLGIIPYKSPSSEPRTVNNEASLCGKGDVLEAARVGVQCLGFRVQG